VEGIQRTIPWLERQVGDGLSILSCPEQAPAARQIVQTGIYTHAQTVIKLQLIAVRNLVFSFLSGPLYSPELRDALDASKGPTSM
jgi:hypothetical protein